MTGTLIFNQCQHSKCYLSFDFRFVQLSILKSCMYSLHKKIIHKINSPFNWNIAYSIKVQGGLFCFQAWIQINTAWRIFSSTEILSHDLLIKSLIRMVMSFPNGSILNVNAWLKSMSLLNYRCNPSLMETLLIQKMARQSGND
jgi:hypothetical protein